MHTMRNVRMTKKSVQYVMSGMYRDPVDRASVRHTEEMMLQRESIPTTNQFKHLSTAFVVMCE